MITFMVLGRPQPAGSKRAFAIRKGGVPTGRVAVSDDNPNGKAWQHEVATVAAQAMARIHRSPMTGGVALDVTFVLRRPKSHYFTGRRADVLRPDAPDRPTAKPDATKLLRCVEDALSGVCFTDDAQVVEQTARKVYGLPERCEIEVSAW